MRLREQIPTAREGSSGVHRLINLNQLPLKSIDFSKFSMEEALIKSIEVAQQKKLSAYSLQFNKGTLRILCIKAVKIPDKHPQIVRQIGTSTYHVMKGHNVV